jgi:hypothetical protein
MNPGQPSPAEPPPGKDSTLKRLFEPLALLLLSMATVGTAWCSYQAAGWNGVAQGFGGKAAAASRTAVANQLRASQVAVLDVLLFSEFINARAASNNSLSRFYSDRFRGEAKTAFDAWMATNPFENSNAPPHPFVTNLYQPRLIAEALLAEGESAQFSKQAGEATRVSRGYILVTVLLACALFCGGTAAKFEHPWIRRAVLALGMAAFLFAAGQLYSLPVQL